MDSVISRVVTVAGGRFGPGHLGELTRIVPFEMVDAALAETGTTQKRLRVLPSRVVVYLRLAAGLFAELGYGQVWARMTAGLNGLAVASPGPPIHDPIDPTQRPARAPSLPIFSFQ